MAPGGVGTCQIAEIQEPARHGQRIPIHVQRQAVGTVLVMQLGGNHLRRRLSEQVRLTEVLRRPRREIQRHAVQHLRHAAGICGHGRTGGGNPKIEAGRSVVLQARGIEVPDLHDVYRVDVAQIHHHAATLNRNAPLRRVVQATCVNQFALVRRRGIAVHVDIDRHQAQSVDGKVLITRAAIAVLRIDLNTAGRPGPSVHLNRATTLYDPRGAEGRQQLVRGREPLRVRVNILQTG